MKRRFIIEIDDKDQDTWMDEWKLQSAILSSDTVLQIQEHHKWLQEMNNMNSNQSTEGRVWKKALDVFTEQFATVIAIEIP